MARQPLAFKKSRNISGDASRRVCTCQNAKQILLFILAPLNCIAPAADKKIMSSAGVGCRSRGWWDSLGPERGVTQCNTWSWSGPWSGCINFGVFSKGGCLVWVRLYFSVVVSC